MNEKCLLSDELFKWMLEKVEVSPNVVFCQGDLTKVSSQSFTRLKGSNYLVKIYRDPDRTSYVDEDGDRRYLRKTNGKLISFGSSGVATEEKDKALFFRFNIQELIQSIKKVNSLSGQVNSIDERIHFIGEHDSGNRQFGVFLGLFADEEQVKPLLGLRQRIKQYENVLVLCPILQIADQGLVSSLERQKVFCCTFKHIFKKDSLQIDFSRIKSPEKIEAAFTAPELSVTEKRKYSKDYPRKDVIEFINKTTSARSGIVLVNGRELELQYNLYGLLLALALALKKETDTGWVHYDNILSEKLVRGQNHFHRSMSELSGKMDLLVEDNKIKILQNMKRKSKYRLSTMPSRIKTPHSRWLSINYGTVKNEIIKERTKRVGEVNV